MMVGIYRTHAALEAAWKYFILGSVGIAFALFGTILVYLAAQPVIGEGINSMVWTELVAHAQSFEPALLNVAFVFLLLGYGTKVGLVPLHAWLPDAHAEGPTPISAVLSGLLLNVALYALLRFKILLAANPLALAPGPLMISMGLVRCCSPRSCCTAGATLSACSPIPRSSTWASLPSPSAWADRSPILPGSAHDHALPHQIGDLLRRGRYRAGQGDAEDRRYGRSDRNQPRARLGISARRCGNRGSPPLGIFISEFLVVSSTFARQPLLAIPLVLGLLIGIGALFLRLNAIAFGEPRGPTAKAKISYVPMFAHLALVLTAGVYLPGPLVTWFQNLAKLLG